MVGSFYQIRGTQAITFNGTVFTSVKNPGHSSLPTTTGILRSFSQLYDHTAHTQR
jgi:hypothetical protein